MKRLATVIATLALIGTPAFAADMAVKAPPPPPAPLPPPLVYSWIGFYVGLNAGGGWGNNRIENTASAIFCNRALVGCDPALPPTFAAEDASVIPSNFDTHPSGFIGGGQIGYNWQTNAFVWGLEADFQGTSIKADAHIANTVQIIDRFGFFFVTGAGTGSQKLEWLGTVRGRLGWLPTNPLLVYVTGGLAYGQVVTGVSFTEQFKGCFCENGSISVSNTATRAGWTLGGGLEWMLAPNWTVRAEYLYYDLGDVNLNTTLALNNLSGTPSDAIGISAVAQYKGSIARGGVNYKF